jgi:Ureidoglycolate hydrolase
MSQPTPPLSPVPLTAEAFAPFGRVIEADPSTMRAINGGATLRFHALARAETDAAGAVILSLFRSLPRPPGPVALRMLERHPDGSQAFMPLGGDEDWLVVAAERPEPGALRAFRARADQGVQFARGVWHHPLLTLGHGRDFMVVDREGPGANLEEVQLATLRDLVP